MGGHACHAHPPLRITHAPCLPATHAHLPCHAHPQATYAPLPHTPPAMPAPPPHMPASPAMHTPWATHPPRPCTPPVTHAPLPCIPPRHYDMWSMSGRYASYWNAFLYQVRTLTHLKIVSIVDQSILIFLSQYSKVRYVKYKYFKNTRYAHKRLYTVLPKYSKIQVLPGITSCRLVKDNKQAIELNSLLINNMPKDGYE